MQCYTEITNPTAVSHSLNLPFLHARANNLVVAKTSLLQIFEFKNVVTEADTNTGDSLEATAPDITTDTFDRTFFNSDTALQKLESTTKLLLIAEFPLAGTVASLARIKLSKSLAGGHALLIAFRDAKVSLVEWDPERHAISTISIHYYENVLPSNPWAPEPSHCPCYLSVDPSNRCAVLRFGPRHLAFLPFHQPEDDLAGDDFDSDLDDPADRPTREKQQTNGDLLTSHTPYGSSFVLPLTAMDPEIIFPIHLAFLHEYREPTFAILYSTKAPSTSLTLERRDLLSYKVFALDLDQRASTTILSVSRLPTDLNRILPLPLPVGGALLLGTNELVHVDQAGKTTAVSANEAAKQSSAFPMTHQSTVSLRLENCAIEPLGDSPDLLLVLASGELAILSFKLDGRSVAGLSIHKVPRSQGGFIAPVGISCSTNIGRGKIFLGSEDNNSIIIGWSRKTSQLSRKRSHADMLQDDVEFSFDEDDIDDEDDIYGGTSALTKVSSRASTSEPIAPESLTFRVHERLPNLCPTGEITFGKASVNQTSSSQNETLQLLYPNGRGRSGGLAVCRQEIVPIIAQKIELPSVKAVWAFHARPPAPTGLIPKGEKDSEGLLSADAAFDQFLLVSQNSDSGGNSYLYSITSRGLEKTQRGDFESEGDTLDIATLSNGTRIVQVKSGEVRCYNPDFGLEQILPMIDEATDAELRVVSVSFLDPYVLILRDDSSAMILEASSAGELEELDRGDGILASKWLSGCIWGPTTNEPHALAFLLTAEGSLRVFALPNLETPVYSTDALPYLPGLITDDFVPRRYAAKETLAEILMADIGDPISQSHYLILRTSLDDLVIYQPYYHPNPPKNSSFFTNLRWKKISQPRLTQASDIYSDEPITANGGAVLRRIPNIGGYNTVFQTGNAHSFIVKEASSMPRVIKLSCNPINSLGPFHTASCERGFISVDNTGTLRLCRLECQTRYGDTGWPTRQISLGQEVTHIQYFEPKNLYVIATVDKVEFKLPDDENHKEWANEDTMFLPLSDQGYFKLIHPANWTIIDNLDLEHAEICLSMTAANLEISEKTHEQRSFVSAGTVMATGEDQATRGKIYVFDVINVVPEPDRPETGFKLKVWAKEEVRGSVSVLQPIGPQGFLLAGQGQKCLVRGLIGDKKLLPVAFMDIQCYATSARVLEGTGLFILGDITKGLWFAGYTEDPYKMIVFGKSNPRMEIVASEFLPQDKQLNILAADSDKNIHVLQYDPENARSASGRRLLHKSTFHTGHYTIAMHLLPSTIQPPVAANDSENETMTNGDAPENTSKPPPLQQILVVTQTGTLALITPVDELMYLRLNAMQTYLNAQLEHACGLNPRGYRAVESERMGIKGIVDGTMLRRWSELPKQRRVEACGRIGTEEYLVRRDLELISGGGLGYL